MSGGFIKVFKPLLIRHCLLVAVVHSQIPSHFGSVVQSVATTQRTCNGRYNVLESKAPRTLPRLIPKQNRLPLTQKNLRACDEHQTLLHHT